MTQLLRFVPNQLKTKKICKHAVKKSLFIIRYVCNWYKSKEMFKKTVL